MPCQEPSILLHPNLGANPRLTVCPSCNKVGDEILLLGATNNVHTCVTCGRFHVGGKPKQCSCGDTGFYTRELRDSERLPALCKTCREAGQQKMVEVCKANPGSIIFVCKHCGSEGVIKADAAFAKKVRGSPRFKDHPLDQPIAVELEDCPTCED